ncbi:hypothetical protein [Mycobacterium tuberculosis]|uniref:hypothetical protein n=1 Tax=Mycobacterium tuberculosis TaxID=1773 RepID=UPI0004B78309|nr:hypothetical protein [Mycobacterium tuberculosis]
MNTLNDSLTAFDPDIAASTGSTDTVIELIFGCYRRHAPPAADKRTPVDKHPTVHERVI